MFKAFLWVIAAFTAITSLAADKPTCANCVDGPEMFEHRHNAPAGNPIDAIRAEDIGSFPDTTLSEALKSLPDCGKGSLVRTPGGADWQVSRCADGQWKFSAANDPAVPGFILHEDEEGEFSFEDDPPDDERARAAYLELRALTKEQLGQLLREARKHR